MSSHWIGIDLGTYNSSAAIKSKSGEIVIVKSTGKKSPSIISLSNKEERCKEFPSFISFNKYGSIDNVGIISKEKIYSEPEFVVWGIKRLLGKSYTELKESGELDRFTYRIRPNRRDGKCLIVIGEKSYTPEQLCAEIFKKIKRDAESQEKIQLDSVVVSVPAYFDPLRVTPIVEAARLAGFNHIKTIPEPVAAAVAYNFEITVKPIKVLVFDLGAGTLDVTTGHMYRSPDQPGECQFQVTKNTGDSRLGGVDMDDRLAKLIQERCQLSDDKQINRATLRRIAELAKITLSSKKQIEKIEFNGKDYHCPLTEFDLKLALEGHGMERNLLEECRRQIMAAIDGSGWFPRDVEVLVLIGGPTRLTCIRDVLKIAFNTNPLVLQQIERFYSGKEQIDRMAAVSIGAAMSIGRKVRDVVPYGYGIEDLDIGKDEVTYKPAILVPRDSTYPFRSKPYSLSWYDKVGRYEFKIIQHIPESEIERFGYEYKFVGIQKFTVKNPDMCTVVFHMGYNANREIEVVIENAFSNESVTYVGISQSTCVGTNYPRTSKRPPGIQEIIRIPPSPETVDRFFKWVQQSAIRLVRCKVDNFPVPQMLISQIIDEIEQLLKRGEPMQEYPEMYTKVYALIHNSSSRGLLSQEEYNGLQKPLADFDAQLFRSEVVGNAK